MPRPVRSLDVSSTFPCTDETRNTFGERGWRALCVALGSQTAPALQELRGLDNAGLRAPWLPALSALTVLEVDLNSDAGPSDSLPALPRLRALTLYKCGALTLSGAGLPPDLRELRVSQLQVVDVPLSTGLETLSMGSCALSADLRELRPLLRLRSLSLRGCRLQGALPPLPETLRELDVSINQVTSLELPPSLEVLVARSCKLAEELRLPDCLRQLKLDFNRGLRLPDALPPLLECLSVPGCRIMRLPPLPQTLQELDARGNSGIELELPTENNLRYLDAVRCFTNPVDALLLFDGVPLPRLEHLFLAGNPGLHAGLRLPPMPSLRVLSLGNCKLEAPLLPLPPTLEHLNLTNNAGISLDALPELPRLRVLNVSGCRTTLDDEELARKFPALERVQREGSGAVGRLLGP